MSLPWHMTQPPEPKPGVILLGRGDALLRSRRRRVNDRRLSYASMACPLIKATNTNTDVHDGHRQRLLDPPFA
eukprot:scaffold226092_cov20-Prasinocladus_malaysianus.AAC.1